MAPEMIPSNCPYCGDELGRRMHEGVERLYCEGCERFIWRNPVPVAAVIVYRETDEVLLIKRGIEPGKGKWSLPAGFLEVEESARDAAARELEEETNLEIDTQNLDYVHDMNIERFTNQRLLANIYSVHYSNVKGDLEPGSDAEDAGFYRLEELRNSEQELRTNFVPALRRLEEIDLDVLSINS